MRRSNIEIMGLGPAIKRLHDLGNSERKIASLLALHPSSVHRELAKRAKRIKRYETVPNQSLSEAKNEGLGRSMDGK
jgi:IS30 family transposase